MYKKIKAHKIPIEDLRALWETTYCNPQSKIYTFDNILVEFYVNQFEHAFFESDNRKEGDKSIISYNRLEKMLWIKDALMDQDAIRKQGWQKATKTYTNSRRVTIVKNNYIVVIKLFNNNRAKFITAYEVQDSINLKKILASPDWA